MKEVAGVAIIFVLLWAILSYYQARVLQESFTKCFLSVHSHDCG